SPVREPPIPPGSQRQRRLLSWRTALTVAGRAVKEYLATLNDAAFGAATEVEPKFVSPPRGALVEVMNSRRFMGLVLSSRITPYHIVNWRCCASQQIWPAKDRNGVIRDRGY